MNEETQNERPLAPRTKELRSYYERVDRSTRQMQIDLRVAFDRISHLEKTLLRTRIERWVLRLAVAAQGALILWLASHLYDCMVAVK